MAKTVDPARARRYVRRTQTRPQESWQLTRAEGADVEAYQWSWAQPTEPLPPKPPYLEWREQVARWASARDHRVAWFYDGIRASLAAGIPPLYPATISWEVEQ